jgi:hypothetical protein
MPRALWTKGIPSVLVAASIALVARFGPGVSVVIQNSSAAPISAVHLEFNGGTEQIPLIRPGGSASVTVNPRGESHLELEFTQGDERRKEVIGVYMEHDYGGTVYLTVDQAGKVGVRDKIKLVWYLPGRAE